MTEYTAFFPFCGIGGGALGYLDAAIRLFGAEYRWRVLGGIDNDAGACADFESLTGVPALCADIATMTPAELRAYAGATAPDIIFWSPPCVGYSGLLGKKASKTAKYRKLNRLVLDWTKLMLAAWPDAPPRLVLLENVPRIATRGKRLLGVVKGRLRRAGYRFHASNHDCGELGGLGQHRRRYLLIGRHERRVEQMVYQPLKKRVRACGEVLEKLPMPGVASAGPMHELPRLSWVNWVRLALIPAGGDWRDLPGVLADGQPRREVHRRHHVGKWEEPSATVAGSGSNGPSAVADPRSANFERLGVTGWDEPLGTVAGESLPSNGAFSVADPRILPQAANPGMHHGKYQVEDWKAPAGTVIGATRVGSGAQSVADPRVPVGKGEAIPDWYRGTLGVQSWDEPSDTVTGAAAPSRGRFSVADPRPPFGNVDRVTPWTEPVGTITHSPAPSSGGGAVADPRGRDWYHHVLKVTPWDEPAGTVTGARRPSSGAVSVADPRVKTAYPHGYGVLRFDKPSFTIAAGTSVGQGAYSVADPRLDCTPRAGSYGVLAWQEAAKTIIGKPSVDHGPFCVADPRIPGAAPAFIVENPKRSPFVLDGKKRISVPVVIISADGTWHRPLTTLELAALQGFPMVVRGKPLSLNGTSSSAHRQRVGNAVPPPAALAIAEQMLTCLAANDTVGFALSSAGGVWVQPEEIGIQ